MSDSVLACFTFCYNIRTLAIEDVPADSLAYGHAQIDIQANASDADASIIFILRQQESDGANGQHVHGSVWLS